MYFDSTHVTIDLDRLVENFCSIEKKAGVPVMAIVKADAYGHGAVPVAKCLQSRCGFFGVSSILEALELRNAGIQTPILVLGRMPVSAYATAISEGIRPSIFRYEDAVALSETAQSLGVNALFHIGIDTGMSRIGFQVREEDARVCAEICRMPGLAVEGLFSHFATADTENLERSRVQAEKFDCFDRMLRRYGVEIPIRHMDNSAGIMNFEHHYEMVRAGIVLYGLYPSEEMEQERLPLQPVLEWNSWITHVKTLEAGREIGYGGTYTTTRPTVVATVPVGYADGYRRNLSGKFYVLIHGQPAPVLGRICMDQMMVDVTHIPDVQVDDRVVLVGCEGENRITVEEIGACADSFNYEIVCGISRRVPRFYRKGGKIVRQVHYLLDSGEPVEEP